MKRKKSNSRPRNGDLKINLLVLGMLILFSCNETSKSEVQINNNEKQTENKSNFQSEKKNEIQYLSQLELTEFLKNTPKIEVHSKHQKPFDTLKFDKVIAYDFDGNEEPYSNVINFRTGEFAPVILRQQELNLKQVDFLINFLTDNKTYGEATAFCFIPHLGIVFYDDYKIKFAVNICLDCNYLISTTEIPATRHNKMKFDDGISIGLRGFSEKGKQKIIDLSKELNLDYGKFEKEDFIQ